MNAPKIISLVAFLFYGAWMIYAVFYYAQDILFYRSPDPPQVYLDIRLALSFLGAPFVSNLVYYLFLRKRSKENRLTKYAIPIALFLALAPVALYGALNGLGY